MPTALKLRYYGDPVLRQCASPVDVVGPSERFFIQEMIRAMYEFDGAGLAAPQVGVERQIFVADAGDGPFVVINPEIVEASSEQTVMEEGCLSLPKIRINIKRPSVIRVRYLDSNGRRVERVLSGLLARIFQHESDHLFARMLIDYATDAELEKFKPQLAYLQALSRDMWKTPV